MNENMHDCIRESIDTIEPTEGARDRMLANIKRKAKEQTVRDDVGSKSEISKVLPFNRIIKWALPIAACFVIAVIGVTALPKIMHSSEQPNPDSGINMIVNPFVTVDSADQFDQVLGIAIDAPAGADNVEYSIVDNKMADIVFDFEGHVYNIRASKVGGDFSGLNGIEAKTEQIDARNNAVLTVIRSGDEFFRKITWTDGSVTFILSNTDGTSDDEMNAVYDKIK